MHKCRACCLLVRHNATTTMCRAPDDVQVYLQLGVFAQLHQALCLQKKRTDPLRKRAEALKGSCAGVTRGDAGMTCEGSRWEWCLSPSFPDLTVSLGPLLTCRAEISHQFSCQESGGRVVEVLLARQPVDHKVPGQPHAQSSVLVRGVTRVSALFPGNAYESGVNSMKTLGHARKHGTKRQCSMLPHSCILTWLHTVRLL